MPPTGELLVVEDDSRNASSLARLLARFRVTRIATSVVEARAMLGGPTRWTALIVDIGLPDGSGLDVASFARSRWPLLPVLVLTGRNDRALINRSHKLRAEFVCKPASEADLFGFVRRAVTFERVPDERLAWLIEELSEQCELTPRETEIVAVTLANTARQQLLEMFQVSENTLKSQIRSVLRKTGYESLDALAKAILRDALSGSHTAINR